MLGLDGPVALSSELMEPMVLGASCNLQLSDEVAWNDMICHHLRLQIHTISQIAEIDEW